MTYPDTMYFVTTADGRSFRVVNDVVLEGGLHPTEFSPQGWEEAGIALQRSVKYWGLDRSFTIPLKAVEDFARILKYRIYKYGTEDRVILVILRRKLHFTSTHYGFYYDHFYKGETDLNNFKHTGPIVQFNAMESGLPKWVKSNENTKYEFPMNVPEAVYVKHTPLRLSKSVTFSTFPVPFETDSEGSSGNPSEVDGFLIPFSIIGQEGDILGIQFQSVTGEPEGSSPNYSQETRWFMRAITNKSLPPITFNFKFLLGRQGAGTASARIELVKGPPSAGTVVHSFFNQTAPASVSGQLFTITQPVTLNLLEGEQYFLRVTLESNSGVGNPLNRVFIKFQEAQTKIEYDYSHSETFVRYFTLKYLLEQLTLKLTEGNHTAESTLLDNIAAAFGPTLGQVLVTCGDALRGFENPILQTSWADSFTSVNAVLCVGAAPLANKLRLERKEFWVDYTNPIVVGNAAPTPSYYPALEFMFNTVKIGYQPTNIEDVNGRYSFNNTQTYSTPYTRQQKEYNAVSVYHADPYLIEQIRINFEGKKSTDDAGDNECYLAACLPIPSIDTVNGQDATVYELDRRLNPYIGTDKHPEPETIFNLPITPKQNLFRHGRFLHSCFFKQSHKYLKFLSTDKWRELIISAPNQRVVDEDADVEIGSLGDQLFIPWLIDLEVESPVDIIDTMDKNPERAIRAFHDNLTMDGISMKLGISPVNNELQNYQLLLAPHNNLENLINVYE